MSLNRGYVVSLLAFVTLGIYYPAIFAPFNSIDDLGLYNYLLNQDSFELGSYLFPGGESSYYRPLLMLSFYADKLLWAAEESFMHLENICLHVMNVLWVYLLTLKLSEILKQESRILPFVAALIFAVHPINVEAVVWVSGRSDLLAGFFVFCSLWCLLCSLYSRRIGVGLLGAASLFLGCLSKETALFFLPGAMLLVLFRKERGLPKCDVLGLKLLCSYLLAACSYLGLRSFALYSDRGVQHIVNSTAGELAKTSPDFLLKVKVLLKASGFYVKKVFVPVPLNFGITKVDDLYLAVGLTLVLFCVYCFVRRGLVAGLFLTSIMIGSSALLAVITGGMWTPIAERYMYIPCAIFVVGFSSAVSRFVSCQPSYKKIVAVLIPLVFVSSAYATVSRCLLWQDNLALFEDTVIKSPDFTQAKNELAIALYKAGRESEAQTIIKSIELSEGQVASLNKAVLLAEKGERNKAKEMLLERLSKKDNLEWAVLERLITLNNNIVRDIDDKQTKVFLKMEIIGWLERMYKLTHDPFHYYRMGRIYLFMGEKESAQRCFSKAADEFPDQSMYKEPSRKLATRLRAHGIESLH